MPTPTLIRNAAWTAEWDAAAGQHFYGQGKDVLLADGRIKPVVHAVFAAANAAQAHAAMQASDHVGKIILDWKQA